MHKQSTRSSTPSNLQLTKQCKFPSQAVCIGVNALCEILCLTEELAKILFFWNLTTCELVYRKQRFEGVFCLHLQGT